MSCLTGVTPLLPISQKCLAENEEVTISDEDFEKYYRDSFEKFKKTVPREYVATMRDEDIPRRSLCIPRESRVFWKKMLSLTRENNIKVQYVPVVLSYRRMAPALAFGTIALRRYQFDEFAKIYPNLNKESVDAQIVMADEFFTDTVHINGAGFHPWYQNIKGWF